MPSSGARSGTKPSRASRGAGNGATVTVTLACGCTTDEPPGVTARGKLWWCCGQWRRARR